MSFALLLSSAFLCLAPEESPDSLLKVMLENNVELKVGRSEKEGQFVIALVRLESQGDAEFSKARQRAMQRIGEYLGAQVSSDVRSTSSETVDDSGKAHYSSFFSDTSQVQVEQTLAGIEGLKVVEFDHGLFVAYMLSEGAGRRREELSRAAQERDRSGPVIVEAMGIATIIGPVEDAKSKALDSAKRTAVEMALGATLVGMTFTSTEEDETKLTSKFCDMAFSATNGFIDSFETLDEREGPSKTYLIRIKATIVANKIFDSYRAHLQAMGDPVFVVDTGGDQPLTDRMTQFFTEKGFRIAEGVAEPDWRIVAQSTYTERAHPTDKKQGVQCQLALKLVNARTGDVASGISTDGKASDFQPGGLEAQKRRAVEMAFKKSADDLHNAINDSIVRMAREGRPVEIRIAGFDRAETGVDAAVPSALQQRLAGIPGLNAPRAGVKNGWVTITLKSLLPSDMLAGLVSSEARALLPECKERVTKVVTNEIEIYLDPKSH